MQKNVKTNQSVVLQTRRKFLNIMGLFGISTIIPTKMSKESILLKNPPISLDLDNKKVHVIGINGFGSAYINQINHKWFKNLSFLTVKGNFSVTASKPRIVLILTGFESRESYQSVEEICKSCEKNNIQTAVIVIRELTFCPTKEVERINQRCQEIGNYSPVLLTYMIPEFTVLNVLRVFNTIVSNKIYNQMDINSIKKILSSGKNIYLVESRRDFNTKSEELVTKTINRAFKTIRKDQSLRALITIVNTSAINTQVSEDINKLMLKHPQVYHREIYFEGFRPKNNITYGTLGFEKIVVLIVADGEMEKFTGSKFGARKSFYSNSV